MPETKILSGGTPTPSPNLVSADQVTIVGDGTTEHPLRAPGSGGGGVEVGDQGTPVPGGPFQEINFVGAGVSAQDGGSGRADVSVPGGVQVQSGGTPVPGGPFRELNFAGAGVSASDGGGGLAEVTVPGGVQLQSGGSPVSGGPFSTLDFATPAVAVEDAGGGTALVTVTGALAISPVATSPVTVTARPQVVRVDPTAGPLAVILPGASELPGGTIYIKNVSDSANLVEVAGIGVDTVDGRGEIVLNGSRFCCGLTSDGVSQWMITQS